ncbi:HAD family phosphatase [Bacteroides helcogenes]|uniref:HAD-superfamily hydrolase, subfamily IA, variant 3 n=1 Tax=Bacteroides helcogenes (strain ATCC 35417 / DSM 20613 / JCM 6297 / CCUG 15421 / P 36-108) TaxID=693979 RepID=E6SS85_BACT6|nr:HAD family hydrolase [Bacteroides helcogenes]ADV44153.1 HAD-superfamily hydrolase, subfamily IA, variant 3 [Bacteroides helcogenes P 36-108]MDY5238434.1 HAD family hydrolase [Bacteroides helcogenes]
MNTMESMAVLFDFDGVVIDTETQYSRFWHQIGKEYLNVDDIENRVKGQTLAYIYDTFFQGMMKEQTEITDCLNRFEQEMSFDFIPGVLDFIADLHHHNVKTAVVTSSNKAKMAAVYRVHPEIETLFDRILTAEMFTASKPAPDCFLLGMEVLGTTPETTYVFEDSYNGLKAGMASGATVIGVATTNPHENIAPLCHYVLDDFRDFTYDKLSHLYK